MGVTADTPPSLRTPNCAPPAQLREHPAISTLAPWCRLPHRCTTPYIAAAKHVFRSALGRYADAVGHPWDLTDEQFDVIRALQRDERVPAVEQRVWATLIGMGMVCIDDRAEPPVARLTPIGRNYEAR